MSNSKISIEKKILKLQKEISALREQQRKEEEKTAQKKEVWKQYVGKTYVYKNNCYSCPENPNDYWDIFYKIISYDKGKKTYQYFSFQKDKYGDVTVNLKSTYSNSDGTPGVDISIASPIPIEEYESQKDIILSQLWALQPRKIDNCYSFEADWLK